MKVIFLDIDGVMKPARSYFRQPSPMLHHRLRTLWRRLRRVPNPKQTTWRYSPLRHQLRRLLQRLGLITSSPLHRNLDPLAVDCINRLHRQTGAVVVTNSTWNLDGYKALRRRLRKEGLAAPVIGTTCYPRSHHGEYTRDEAIQNWLQAHPEVTHWCALDDAHLAHEFAIQVDAENGLSVDNYRQASLLLEVKDPFIVLL